MFALGLFTQRENFRGNNRYSLQITLSLHQFFFLNVTKVNQTR